MPVRRLEREEQEARLGTVDQFLLQTSPRASTRYIGYLYVTETPDFWRGYITLNDVKYKLAAKMGTDRLTGTPTLEMEFMDERWLASDGQQFMTALFHDGSTWRSEVYLPSALRREDDDTEWIKLSFGYERNPGARRVGHIPFAWRIRRRG